MKKIIVLLLSVISVSTFAQNKQFTLEEAVLGLGTTLAPINLKQLQFMGSDDKSLAHIVLVDSIETIQKIQFPEGNSTNLFSLKTINEAIQIVGIKEIKRMPTITWMDSKQFYCSFAQDYIQFELLANNNLRVQKMYTLPKDASNIDIEPITKQVAFVSNYNLFIQKVGDVAKQITTDGNVNLLYATSVHRDEFGISKGTFWSNNGTHLAFYKMDQSMVTDYPIIDWNDIPAKVTNIKYPFAGQKSHEVKLMIHDVKQNKSIQVNTIGTTDQYLTMVTWHPENEYIYIGLLNRNQKELNLNKYKVYNGEFEKTILTESNSKYVEPQHPLYFLQGNKNKLIYISQKSGYMHLYTVNESNGKLNAITDGSWIVNEYLGYNAKTDELIFTGTKDGAMQKQTYAVQLNDNKIRRITKNDGWHNTILNQSHSMLLDVYSNMQEPKNIEILAIEGDFEKRLLSAKNTLQDYAVATIEQVKILTENKTELYAKLMLPKNFDSSKKYPVIVYLYNGPHIQLNKNTFPASGNLWYDYLTQNGYIVFVLDGRGSANRGLAFESATHQQLGTIEMEDQLLGVNYLKKLPFVNANKMGVHGWSFGGFMTTSLMLRKPDVFAAGVAGGPVMDWSKYEIMYTERYMSTPDSNKIGFDESNLLTKTKNLKNPLLIIHGTDDDVVVWQHSLNFVKKCVDNGIQLDYFVYPGHPHNVRGKDRVHLMKKITDYFDLHLKN